MFRIESYITSIILSYVDRYIKNFRQQDAQVSLWEGDGVFQNLNLDLDVLEQELNLPFSFVSGHIHELRIHVPWTRLTSESVQITINTIECVMKLKPVGTQQPQPKTVRKDPQTIDDPQSQLSLKTSLVNKIICNLSVTCNNLILKYVEEDIVLSMNIKTLSFGTVNSNWEPAFIELSATQLELRKLISLSDVTVCLDKRNASGRIETYLEPLLYRCFVTARLWQLFGSASARRASSTRLHVLCESMAFTVSQPQVPMLLRLAALCLALQRKQLSNHSLAPPTLSGESSAVDTSDQDSADGQVDVAAESWSSWALSWMPSLLPLEDLDSVFDPYEDSSSSPPKNVINLGFYIDTFTLCLKLCDSDSNLKPQSQSQSKPQGALHVELKGCRVELSSLGSHWTNAQAGVSQAEVRPGGDCCCGVSELSQLVYLSSGSLQADRVFLSGSLFYNTPSSLQVSAKQSWKHHLEAVSETIMLERTPAFAVDYLSCVQDKEDDEESDDEDEERLPAKEKVVIRYVAGPVVVRVCSGLIHRIQMLMKACASYDYIPYTANVVQPVVQDNHMLDLVHRLSEKSVEMNEDLYGRYLPVHTAQFTAFNTVVELYPANHLPVHLSTLGRKLSRSQRRSVTVAPSPPPCATLEWQCVYATLTRPLYPDKIQAMASRFQRDKLPPEITNTALTRLVFKAVGVSSSLRLPFLQAMKVIEMSSVTSEQTWHSLITPLDDKVSSDIGLHIENVTATSSKAQLILVYEIVGSLIATNNRQHYLAAHKTIYGTTLLHDAATNTDTIYLRASVEEVRLQRVLTQLSQSTCLSVSTCLVFAGRLLDRGETIVLAALGTTPLTTHSEHPPVLQVLYQQPTSLNVFPPLLAFKISELRLSADPLLYSWLLYTPTPTFNPHQSSYLTQKSNDSHKSRKVSESSLSSYLRRAPTPQESAHSSSERETTPSTTVPLADTVPVLPLADRVAGWYPVWKTMIVCGDVSHVSVYMPRSSLASATAQTMEEDLQTALKHQSPPAQIAVMKLPTISLRCGNYKQGLQQYTAELPVRLPQTVWNTEKDNFPWILTFSDLHCYTLHGKTSMPLLKPVSFNCTIGTSPKFTDSHILSSLALCVHLDTTPVDIKISEEQVVLLVQLLVAQLRVARVFMPAQTADYSTADAAPCVKLMSSDESSISQSDDISRNGAPVKVKLTGWLQWTLARTTLTVYSRPRATHGSAELKLTLDVEDAILSLDVEQVYHKVKLKVATASVCHYIRESHAGQWKRGAFQGLVMRGRDPDTATMKPSTDDGQAPAGFLTATVTRAKCNNVHSRLGSPVKHSSFNKKALKSEKFITEIEVKMQPLDFVLSPTTLGIFVHVLEPLLSLTQVGAAPGGQKQSTSSHPPWSLPLPLLYLELMTIRVVLPTCRDHLSQNQPDVVIIQFDGMTANHLPENPICRSPLRPDLYHKGEKQRILNIPGSELEDRQYQFNLSNVRVQTGKWQQVQEVFISRVTESQQNPALDWNEGRSPLSQAVSAQQTLQSIVQSFNLSLVAAPAMFYRDKDVVCGHAAEINAVSDIVVTLTLDQLFLCGVLAQETLSVLGSVKRGSGYQPPVGTGSTQQILEQDSGVESTSSHTRQVDPNIPGVHTVSSSGFSQISGFVPSSLPSTIYPTPLVWPGKRSVIPCEVLITGSAVTFSLFAVEFGVQVEGTYEPLLYTHVSQPHAFLCRSTDNVFSCQVSLFDLSVSCGVRGHSVTKPVAKPCPQPLLETRSGEPNPLTGIPPALLTLKVAWSNDKPPKVDLDMGRPVRVICSLETIKYVNHVRSLVAASLFVPPSRYSASRSDSLLHEELLVQQIGDHYIRKILRHFSKFSLSTQQIVLAVSSSPQNGAEMCVSLGGVSSHLNSSQSMQHALTGVLRLGTVTVSTRKVTSPRVRLLLCPWSMSISLNLWWDSWLSAADPPLASLSADSDVLSLQLSPEQLDCLTAIRNDYAHYFEPSAQTREKQVVNTQENSTVDCGEEQQYHDDLQAGAFQLVESAGAREDLPLTYQVVFWAGPRHTPTMAWRYPQPRALTRFCLLPVPFRDSEDHPGVVSPQCVLQYYSESQGCYQDLVCFSLSQSDSQLVPLPQGSSRVVATTWRVTLSSDAALVTSVKALAASIRVDSFFSPALIPSVQLAVNLTAIQVSLWTFTDSYLPLPPPLDRYYLDRRFPEEHNFFSVKLEQANVSFSLWPKVSQVVTVRGRACIDVLNYDTLSRQCCVPPVPLTVSGHSSAGCNRWSLLAGLVHVRFGPALSHGLLASLNTWTQQQTQQQLTILTPYVICNNTCLPIRFRQAGSDEYIPLQVFQCHMYSWRTTKHPMKLEFGLMEPEDIEWSKGLTLEAGTNQVVRLASATREFALIVSVKRLTPTVSQVTVNGQLSLHNKLSSPLDVRVIPERGDQSVLTLQGEGGAPPSLVLDPHHPLSLRLRLATASQWSGEIPLRAPLVSAPAHQTRQWEVKLPLKEKGQFRSVWCHVIWEVIENIHQMLVVVSPLYTIKSLLACPASVLVETPALSTHQALPITGQGTVQELDTPGLSLEKHDLTFQLDGKVPVSSPPVSLHYHMLDSCPTPEPEDSDVNTLLAKLQTQPDPGVDQWPYLGADWATVDWVCTTQPDTVTQVKVRFSDDCVAKNTLLVEVQPWALLVNTLGSHVYLHGKERTLCGVPHRAVISPPPLESTFQIGVELQNSVQLSDPIQLKRGPGFEMPHIPGLLPPSGFINTTIACKDSVCFMNVTSSEVCGLRLIHVRSSFTVASLSTRELSVTAAVVKPSDHQMSLPSDSLRPNLTLRPQPKAAKIKSQPLFEWRVLGGDVGDRDELIPYLIVTAAGVASCPVHLPVDPERHSTMVLFPVGPSGSAPEPMVLTTQTVEGQTHALLWDQPWPQLTVHNNTNSAIIFGKARTEGEGVVADCEHIRWQLRVPAGATAHYHFPTTVVGPETAQPHTLPPAAVAVVTNNNEVRWSDSIALTHCSGRLLTLLGLPDLSLSVSKRGFTTHVTLAQASHTEILAVDIRGQLSRQLLNERRASNVSQKSAEEPDEDREPSVPPSLPPSESEPGEERGSGLDLSCFVLGLSATLLSHSEQGCECSELAALSLDSVTLTLHSHPHQDSCVREMKAHLTIGDMQLDNQEFIRGGYDFPVVLLMQKPPEPRLVKVDMREDVRALVERERAKGSAVDLTMVMDVNSHASIALQDVSVKFQPLQIYIEDKYVLHMKDCLTNTLPMSLFGDSPANPSSSTARSQPRKREDSTTRSKDLQKPVENKAEDFIDDNLKRDLSDNAEEEDLFNVSEPDLDNQSPEEVPTGSAEITPVRQANPTYAPESIWTVQSSDTCLLEAAETQQVTEGFPIPGDVLSASRDLARPLRLRSLSISELDLLVSIHTSTRFYIALDHSPLQLAAFKRSSLFTTAYRLGHSLTLHYFFGAIYGTGWALGSLELLGAPGGLARSLGLGLRDFISLPLQGMLVGPRAFFTGIAHGSASLMQHFAAGTITSVTRLASSWARTLDRLTLDCRDLERSEQLRRLRPQSLTQGVVQGLTGFGISLIGGISSIAHHPLQYVMSESADRSLVSSVGRGLMGVLTRPLSGVAELVALTGEGLLTGVGWTNTPVPRQEPMAGHTFCGSDSHLKYQWKLLLPGEALLVTCDAATDCYEAVTLLVTHQSLYVVNAELDIIVRAVKLAELRVVDTEDPTVVAFRIQPAREQAQLLSQSRVVQFVRESQRVLIGELPPTPPSSSPVHSSPLLDPYEPHLQFYINPQLRNHFLAVLAFATNHALGKGFAVIS